MKKFVCLLLPLVAGQSSCDNEPIMANNPIEFAYNQTKQDHSLYQIELNDVYYFMHGLEGSGDEYSNQCEFECQVLASDCSSAPGVAGLSTSGTLLQIDSSQHAEGEYCVLCSSVSTFQTFNVRRASTKLTIDCRRYATQEFTEEEFSSMLALAITFGLYYLGFNLEGAVGVTTTAVFEVIQALWLVTYGYIITGSISELRLTGVVLIVMAVIDAGSGVLALLPYVLPVAGYAQLLTLPATNAMLLFVETLNTAIYLVFFTSALPFFYETYANYKSLT